MLTIPPSDSRRRPQEPADNRPKGSWEKLESAPLLLPAVAFLAGTLLSGAAGLLPAVLLPALLLLLAGAGWWLYLRGCLAPCWICCLLGFLIAGGIANQEAVRARQARLAALQALIEPGVVPEWKAALDREPEVTPERTLLYMELQSAEWQGRSFPLGGRVRISVYPSENGVVAFPSGQPQYGDVLCLRTSLARPRNFRNPGMFDFAANLERDGILLSGSLKSPLLITRCGQDAGNRLASAAYSFRRSFRGFLRREFTPLPAGGETYAILDALLFGDQSGLSREVTRLFQETGTYHIFVVSGFNTAIIALFLTGLLRMLRVPMPLTVPICGAALLFYALMTGMEPPVVRASILSFTVLLSQALFRRGTLINSLSLAALVSLLFWPEAGPDASFVLTYLACLAILLIGIPWTRALLDPFHAAMRGLFEGNASLTKQAPMERWARRARFETELALEWLLRQRGLSGRGFRISLLWLVRQVAAGLYYLCGLLLVSAAIHLMLSPLMAFYFNRANSGAYLANLFVVPALTLVLLSALVFGSGFWLTGWVWHPWVAATGWLVRQVVSALQSVAGIDGWHWRVATPPIPWVWLYYGVLLLAFLPLARRWRRIAGAVALVLLPSFWWNPFPMQRQSPGRLEAYVLDVGQGESILVISPEGRTLLVDAGGFAGGFTEEASPSRGRQAPRFDVGEEIVSRALWTLRVRSLDYVLVTHPQIDHAGGLPAVLENFPAGALMGPQPANRLGDLLPQVTAVAAGKGLDWRGLQQGDRWSLGSCQAAVLSPPESLLGPFSRINDRSVVIKITCGTQSLLLTGDIEKQVERELMRDCAGLRADILKLPHHGSATSSTEAFLGCVQPRWALISAGYNNRFGHPHPEVLKRLRAREVEYLETSRQGALLATLGGSGAAVRPALPAEQRLFGIP